jgi:hypothetical protein
VKARNNRRDVPIARCSCCRATVFDGVHPEGRFRWQHCTHESWCEFGSVTKTSKVGAVDGPRP